jgi:4,5-dihydroxyphthalate decarboxylase
VNLYVRADSAIDGPGALAGKRVGVSDLAISEALWTRAALTHQCGVASDSIEWFGEAGASALASRHARALASGQSALGALAAGDLDAALLSAPSADAALRPLFADTRAEARRYHEATDYFPILSVVVVSAAVVERYPWVVLNLFSAFLDAKLQASADAAARLGPFVDTGTVSAATAKALGADLFPYGVAAQRAELEAAATFAREQQLTVDAVALGDMFYPPTLEL